MSSIKRILFICYANICRSPYAEKGAKLYADKLGLKDVSFDSAGWHKAFDTATQDTKDYAKEEKGIDMNDFESKLITRELIEQADLIIGMEKYHLHKVKRKFRDLREHLEGKLFTLKQFNGANRKDWNIPDPYETGRENYFRIMNLVDENVEKLVRRVVEMNGPNN